MEVKVRHIYDQPVDAVFTKLGDKASVERKYKDLGARNVKVEKCKLTKTSLEIVMSREVPANVPPLLKKFIAQWNVAHQEERWTGVAGKGYQGHFKISVKGVPVTIAGKMALASKDKGCVNDVTMTIESGIPLIGKKLAEFVAQNSVTELQKQYEVVKASLVPAPSSAKKAVAKPVAKAVGAKPAAKAIAVKPAAKKVAAKVVKTPAASKPAAKKAVRKVVAQPAVARKGVATVAVKSAPAKKVAPKKKST